MTTDTTTTTIPQARADLALMVPPNATAAELGVARGKFSVELLARSDRIARLFSIDRWTDHHDEDEFATAKAALAPFGARSRVLRKTFADALKLFPGWHFDLIYIDGYAHTGQEDGQTLRDWWGQLKPGGIFAGHDYDPAWPLTIAAVDAFAARVALPVHTIPGEPQTNTHHRSGWDKYASWYILKA